MDDDSFKWGQKVLLRDTEAPSDGLSENELDFVAVPRNLRNAAANALAMKVGNATTYQVLGRHRWRQQDGELEETYEMSDWSETERLSGRRRERELQSQAEDMVRELQLLEEAKQQFGNRSNIEARQQQLIEQLQQLASEAVLVEQIRDQHQAQTKKQQKLAGNASARNDPLYNHLLNRHQSREIMREAAPVGSSNNEFEASSTRAGQPVVFAAAGACLGLAIPGVLSRLFGKCKNRVTRLLLGALTVACFATVSWQLGRPPAKHTVHDTQHALYINLLKGPPDEEEVETSSEE